MSVIVSHGKLLATGLLAVSLILPSVAMGEPNDELAPGFDACMKQVEQYGASKCYEAADKYWTSIFEAEYAKITKNGDAYSGDFGEQYVLHIGGPHEIQDFRLAWEEYLRAGGNLICTNGGLADPIYAQFVVGEKKRIVEMLRNLGIFSKPDENTK